MVYFYVSGYMNRELYGKTKGQPLHFVASESSLPHTVKLLIEQSQLCEQKQIYDSKLKCTRFV